MTPSDYLAKHGFKIGKISLVWVLCLSSISPANAWWFKKKNSNPSTVESVARGDTPDSIQIALSEIFRQKLYEHLQWDNTSFREFMPSIDLTLMESAFFGSVVRYISESPALGGSYERGFKPIIWNNIVKVMMERSIPMTPDGVLLLPASKDLRISALSPELIAKGKTRNARLFLVNGSNELIGPDLLPVRIQGYETLDGDTTTVGSLGEDMAGYANLQNEILNHSIGFQYNPKAKTSSTIFGDEDYSLTDCFRLVADGNREEASACFRARKEKALADGVELTKNLVVTGARGAATGATVGSMIPGIGSGAAAAYGSFTNMVMVVFNTYLKKEKISGNDLRRLFQLMNTYTFTPTAYGEILPKVGAWAVTEKGVIRRITMIEGQPVVLDALGRPIMRGQTIQISEGAQFISPRRGNE